MKCDCSVRKKQRSDIEYKKLVNRLNRIEGQVRGIRNMLENDVYCIDILTQITAVNAAINAFSKELLTEHINTCVKNDLILGDSSSLNETILTIQKMMK